MKTFSEFLIERRKAGKLSGILAALALLVHGAKEAHEESKNSGHLLNYVPHPHYMDLTGTHGHNAGHIINRNEENKEEENKEEENDESTRRP